MNDEDALKLLRETLENAKKTTESYSCAFFRLFSDFASTLISMSSNIQNKNLRVCSLYFFLLSRPLKGFLDYTFQKQVIEKLEASLEGEKFKEIILNVASTSLSIRVLSDDDGRDVVDIGRLREDFEKRLESLDEVTKVFVTLKVTNAIREIFDSTSFVEESKKEIIGFYDKLIESSRKDWLAVYDALREYLLTWDKKAVIWSREEV
jgi:hypothetical protein